MAQRAAIDGEEGYALPRQPLRAMLL